jgi:hypothetical protein
VARRVGRRSLTARYAICLALLMQFAASVAQGAGLEVECVDPAHPRDKIAFHLDFDWQVVNGAFPVSWTWFAERTIVFGYSTVIAGHYRTLQSYTLDRTTGMLEVCDFTQGDGEACRRRQCFMAPSNTLHEENDVLGFVDDGPGSGAPEHVDPGDPA